jgi:hypothetical protein
MTDVVGRDGLGRLGYGPFGSARFIAASQSARLGHSRQRGSPTTPTTMRSARTWLTDCFALIEMTRRLGLRKGAA